MGYSVRPDGSIDVDSLEDAIALSQRITGKGGAISAPPDGKQTDQTPALGDAQPGGADWEVFLREIRDQHRVILKLVKDKGSVRIEEISQALGGNAFSTSGLLTGLKRIAKRALGSESAILKRESKGYGKARVLIYKAGPRLQGAPPL